MKKISDLLAMEMTRKEFLVHIILVLVAFVGVSDIARKISEPNKPRETTTGFGGGPYGI